MKAWVLSVVAVIVLGVLLEIVLPSGKVAKYAKGAFSLVVVLVMIAPLPRLLKTEWNFDFSTAWQNANMTFEEETKEEFLTEKTKEIESALYLAGIECKIELEEGRGRFDVVGATIYLVPGCMQIELARSAVANMIGVDESKVKVVVNVVTNNDEG